MDIETPEKFALCGKYVITRNLGSGTFGKVKLGQFEGNYYAIKILNATSCNQQELITKALPEIKAYQSLTHQHLVKMEEFGMMRYVKKNLVAEDRFCIVLEYISGGELYQFLKLTGPFPENVARFYFKQLISALDYMHKQGFVHRDLKPENIVLDAEFNLKLADFGFTQRFNKNGNGLMNTPLGTKSYMAPEILMNQSYNGQLVDFFASAVILFGMATMNAPFGQASRNDQLYKFILMNRQQEYWMFIDRENKLSDQFKQLFSALVAFDPTQRLSISEIMAHPWFSGPIPTEKQIFEEFTARKAMVDLQMMKKKVASQAAQQEKKPTTLRNGIGNFHKTRSLDTGDEEFLDVEKQYNLRSTERVLYDYDPNTKQFDDYFTYFNPDYLLRFLLRNAKEYSTIAQDMVQVSRNTYKIKYSFILEDVKNKSQMTFYKVDDNEIFINFMRLEGPALSHYKMVARIQQLINKHLFELTETPSSSN